MKTLRTLGQSLATATRLVLVAIISLGLATTLHVSGTNTLSLLPEAKALPSVPPPLFAHEPSPLDAAMNVLSPNDALRYRTVFAAQRKSDWARADEVVATLGDKRLMGHVLADRYQRGRGSSDELRVWLKNYADLPEAGTIYALAKKRGRKGLEPLLAPRSPGPWSGGYEADGAANFTAYVQTEGMPPATSAYKLARAVNRALRRNDPAAALSLLKAAGGGEGGLTGTVASETEAAIAASYFYMGEREQARALAGASAKAEQPLGLWIRGLIAWEQDDFKLAAASFKNLAGHPAAEPAGRAAASFWAYRALNRGGHTKESRRYLEQASLESQSFYGLLAAQLLGKVHALSSQKAAAAPGWNKDGRSVLAGHAAGWRALALVQVGETTLAESELRRLNPQGLPELREAMKSLAHFARMPGLTVQLASLSSGSAASLYPLPPWRPQNGFEVDRALIYALARHESQFDPAAVSPRGARGLLQIMPATANVMDKRSGKAAARLFEPEYNLELGQKYVHHLVSQPQIGNNLLLVLAAYNTGPGKVARWVETQEARNGKKSLDPLLFVESIPQRETRQYLTRVLPHYWAYRARLDAPLTTLRQLAEGKWPRLPAASEKGMRQVDAAEGFKVASSQKAGGAR